MVNNSCKSTFLFVLLVVFYSCGLDNAIIIDSPLKVDNRASRDILAFRLPSSYFNTKNNAKIKGFDIYYKFYPEGSNYYSNGFTKSVQKDFDVLKSVFNNINEFNRMGFYKINLDDVRFSGKPTFKLDKSWIQNKFSLYFELNFENLRKSTPGSVLLSVKKGNDFSAPVIGDVKTVYRSYTIDGAYIEFSEALKKFKLLNSDERPFDLKHISDDFFKKDVVPKYNLVIFVMAVGNPIEDDLYSVIVNIGSLHSFELSN
ncbi:hypothetical protein [Borrelia sp. HM]|uniref:hypothetical protein n=1 Tax=Borrelia sp. HM TaxID=1882662 RepID=UPI001C77AF1D|nr:hypothetical protein [Borrelia sp. HM]BCR21569.1 hypothetical protein BKFM_00131 [Borrelia sp. HM]